MINSLKGIVQDITKDSIIIDVSGFGVEVFPTKSLLQSVELSKEIFCITYLKFSDAGPSMFGFSNEDERSFFMELIKVNSVGGKVAITLMQYLDVAQIVSAIQAGNVNALKAPGIGLKTADKICYDMKKVVANKFMNMANAVIEDTKYGIEMTVTDALTSLGFTQADARRALAFCYAQSDDSTDWTEETLLKAALSVLQRSK